MAETLAAGEALIALRATSEKLSADMAAATKLITGELQKVEKSVGTINLGSAFKDGLAAATAFAGGVATVAGAVTALALQSTRTGDELNRMSEALGISVEDLSGLKMQAEDADVSFGQLQVGIKTLANQIADAAGGSKQAVAVFQALGISVTDANGQLRPTGDILRDVSDAMAGMEDGAGKTAIATQLLGRSGQDLIPVLNQGSAAMRSAAEEARGLGVAFTSETAAAAGKLDDQLDRLGHQIGGVANQIGVGLIPVISDAVGSVSGLVDQNESLISQGVETWVLGVKAGVEGLLPYVSKAIGLFHDLGDAMFGVANQGTLEGLRKQEEALKKEIDYYERWGSETDAVKDKLANLRNELAGVEIRIQAASGATVAGADAFRDLAGASGETAKATTQVEQAHRRAAPVIASTGDAADKAAKKLVDEAKSLADSADKATQYAQSQLELAAATGDIQRVQDAYIVTIAAAREAYEKSITAADAAAKAGKSDAEVQNMRTEALRQYVTTAQGAAGTLAKIGAEQIKAAQDLSKYTADLTIARDQDALSMASAKDVGELYTKTLVDIGERLKAEREEIEAKRGVTISAAEADKLLMEAEERAAQEISKAGAAAAKAGAQLSKMDQIIDDLAGHLAEVSLDLGLALLGGQLSWKEAGKQLAADFAKEALDELKAVLLPSVKSLFTSMLSSLIPGASSIGSGVGQAAGSSILSGILGPISKAGSSIAGGLADAISPGITSEAAALGMGGGEALVTSMADSILSLLPTSAAGAVGTALGAGGVVAAAVAGVAGIGVAIAAAFGAFEGPTMVQKIARAISKMLRSSFDDPEVRQSINEGLESVGLFLGDGLEKIMTNAPRKMGAQVAEAWAQLGKDSSYQFSDGFYQDMRERGAQLIHSSIADVLNVFFPQITHDVAVGIQQSAVAAGSAMARELGLVGDKAIKFANQWAIAFIGMMQQAGKGADEILTALHRIDSSLGTSQELVASFQRLQAVLMESGEDMDALFAKINEQLRIITGKKVKVGNLDEVLAAVGGDATRALGVVENAMEMAGISIERFSGQLSDVVLAISGDAGTAIRDASKDMEDFGNYSDGTAQILEQKVVTALGNVVKTAEQLGYTPESIEALGTAASLISPELLKSDVVVQALHDSFAEMAVGAHMSIRELIDSIDPPLEQSVRDAILAVDDLGRALGALSDAPLSSLKEVTDRMKQFAGDMYREVRDAEGNVSKELTAFGEQLVKDAVSAIGGMWDTITADGVIDPSDVQAVFEQLAQIPEEVLGDPAVQSSIQSLLAMIGEQTGDAFVIGLSALPEVTKEQLDEALGIYDQWKKDVEDNPPEVAPEVKPPENPDGSPSNPDSVGATGPDTSAATAAPPPAPVPPETVKSWEAITEAAKAYAAAVVEGTTATTALSSEVVTRSAEMLAAIQPIYGTPDDETSLSAINELIGPVLRATIDETTAGILGATGTWHDSFDYARGGVLMLKEAIDAIPSDKTITFHLVTDGSIPTVGTVTADPPKSHSGELIPGAPGTEALRLLEAGELVLPADLSARLLSGAVITSADVARIASAPVPTYASSRGASSASQAAPALPIASGWTFVPIREEALIDRALVRLERDTRDGRGTIANGRFTAHPLTHARARRG